MNAVIYTIYNYIIRNGETAMKKGTRFLYVVGCVALTTAGIVIIPKIIQNQGNRIYKSSLAKDEIDIDSMGPVIVPLDDNEIPTEDSPADSVINKESDISSGEKE